MTNKLQKLNFNYDLNLDLIRIVAVLLVISVHFFLNNGFYQQKIVGNTMYFMTIMRTFFMTCVPLFLLLTGYLMSPKNYFPVKRKYFFHLTKILAVYLITTIFILLFQKYYLHRQITILGSFLNIVGYSQYSWYVNMYIGLALIVPYLNLIWHNMGEQKNELMLLGIMIFMTIIPTVANIFDFSMLPKGLMAMKKTNQLVPNWWVDLYPVTYYFIGAYLRKYHVEDSISKIKLLQFLLIFGVLFGTFNFYRSYGRTFVWGGWNDWGSLQNTVDSVLLFLLLRKISLDNIPAFVKSAIHKMADLTFGIYLASWILDRVVYKFLKSYVPVMQDRVYYYVPTVISVFVGSLVVSYIVSNLHKILLMCCSRFFKSFTVK